jgi:hypothetical protein
VAEERNEGMVDETMKNSPLLNLVEGLELGHGDEDNDRLLATTDVDLTSGRDLERAELSLEVTNRVLEVNEGLGDAELDLVGLGVYRVRGAVDLVLNRGHD